MMERAFQLFDQAASAIVVQSRMQTERPGANDKRSDRLRRAQFVEAPAQKVVDQLLERAACSGHFLLQSGGNVIV